jgi:hypothetical protein
MKPRTIDEEISELEHLVEQRREQKTQTNGGDCDGQFEQIAKTQLLQYLRGGWQIVHRLSVGQIIVKR